MNEQEQQDQTKSQPFVEDLPHRILALTLDPAQTDEEHEEHASQVEVEIDGFVNEFGADYQFSNPIISVDGSGKIKLIIIATFFGYPLEMKQAGQNWVMQNRLELVEEQMRQEQMRQQQQQQPDGNVHQFPASALKSVEKGGVNLPRRK